MYLQIVRETGMKYGMVVDTLKEALVAMEAADLSTEHTRTFTLDDELVECFIIKERIKAASFPSSTLEVMRGAEYGSWKEADNDGAIYGIPVTSREDALRVAEGARLANTCIGSDSQLKFRVVTISEV